MIFIKKDTNFFSVFCLDSRMMQKKKCATFIFQINFLSFQKKESFQNNVFLHYIKFGSVGPHGVKFYFRFLAQLRKRRPPLTKKFYMNKQ